VYGYGLENFPESWPAKIIVRENFCVDGKESTSKRRGNLGNCCWSLRNLRGDLDLFHELRGNLSVEYIWQYLGWFGLYVCGALACSQNTIGPYVIFCLYLLPREIDMITTDFATGLGK